MATRALKADAQNRAVRTFIQGLAIDLLVAVSILLYAATQDANFSWALLGASLLRTVVQSAAAYVMRAFADPSRIPTPLPPTPQPPPAERGDGYTTQPYRPEDH